MGKNSVLVKLKISKTLWKRQQKKDMRYGKKIKRKIKIKSNKKFKIIVKDYLFEAILKKFNSPFKKINQANLFIVIIDWY